jgi:hypothetical protein
MEIDPVVALAEQLRATERSLQSASDGWQDERTVELRTASLIIRRMLETTEPTSAMGAAELVAIAADRLAATEFPYIADLRSVGQRFGEGQRVLSDLIWLRAVVIALEADACGERGRRAASLLRSAVEGASKPLIIYRSAVLEVVEDDDEPHGGGTLPDFRARFGGQAPLAALSSLPER